MSAVFAMSGRLLRQGLPGLVALLAGIALLEFVQPLVIASFGGASGLDAIMNRIPPALQVFVRARPEFLAMSGLAGYLSLGFNHPLFLVLAGAAVVGFAARSLAGEMDRGTIQIPLSRAISRPAVYASRILAGILICLLVSLIGPLGTIAGMLYARPNGEFAYANLTSVFLSTFALLWAIGGVSLCGSAIASAAGRVVGWALGILVFSYFVDYFASVWRPLQAVTFLSMFNYYDPASALVSGEPNARHLAILLTLGAVAALLGLVAFTRRDLPT